MKTICIPLVNRTNYTKMKPLMVKLRDSGKVKLDVIVSSSMLLSKYSKAYKDVENDGFEIRGKFNCLLSADSHDSMVQTSALSMVHHSNYFKDNRPDLLFMVGDRFDMFPIVLSAGMMNIPIAHIQGGELSSSIDNTIRDMISTMASLHFPATELSKRRLEKLGCTNVWNYGCPSVEYINSIDVGHEFDQTYLHKTFKNKIDIEPGEPYVISMMHPDTTNPDDLNVDMVLKVLKDLKVKSFIFYPNADTNNSHILESIHNYSTQKGFYLIKHIPIEGYIHLLTHAACMVGNSSSGIREAATFGTPVVNIGDRQANREVNKSTISVDCNYDTIKSVVKYCLHSKYDKTNIYYKRGCTDNICKKVLEYIEGV